MLADTRADAQAFIGLTPFTATWPRRAPEDSILPPPMTANAAPITRASFRGPPRLFNISTMIFGRRGRRTGRPAALDRYACRHTN